MRGETGGIGDQTEMSGNGMEKLSQGTEFKDSGKRTGIQRNYSKRSGSGIYRNRNDSDPA